MTNPVLKVALNGKSTDSTDIRDFALHSSHMCDQISSIEDGSVIITAGGTSGNTTVTHDLGYVPEFDIWEETSNGYKLWPKDIDAYVTTTGITITKKISTPYNQTIYTGNQAAFEDSTSGYNIIAGKKLSTGTGSAVRFTNIIASQGESIVSASFEWKSVVTTTTSDIKFKIWGIDQDNCGSFSDYGDANGRSKTDAYNTKTQAANTSEFNFADTWTSLLQEIINRPGWTMGNAVGFVFNDNGTDNNKVLGVSNSYGTDKLELTIVRPGSLTTNYKVVIYINKISD